MHKILIVEDEPAVLHGLELNFRREGYRVLTAATGEQCLALMRQESPGVILLDIMLPGMSGLEVCRELRRRGYETPVILLTARAEEMDRVVGLEIGADDYVTKPFSLRELIARVHVQIRRAARPQDVAHYGFDGIEIDFERLRATRAGAPIELTSKEFDVLRLLIRHRGEVVTRERLLREVWGYEIPPHSRTVDTHILKLRQKLGDHPDNPKYIAAVWGEGYRFIG